MYDDDGNLISSTSVEFRLASQWNFSNDEWQGYGWRSSRNTTMATRAITDDALNLVSNLLAIKELYLGSKFIYMGLTSVSTSSVGIRTVLGASQHYVLQLIFKRK